MDSPRFTLRKRTAAIVAALLLAGGLATTTIVISLRVTPSAPPAPTILSGPSNPSSSTSATFTFTDGTAGVGFRCSLDGAAYSSCSSGTSYGSLEDGTHTFRVTARNGSSPDSKATSYTWVIDTGTGEHALGGPSTTNRPPRIELTFPADGTRYQLASWAAGCVPSPPGICGLVTDSVAVTSVTVSIRQQSTGLFWDGLKFGAPAERFEVATLRHVRTDTTGWNYALSLPPNGVYDLHVVATDALGNTTVPNRDVRTTFSIGLPPPPPAPVITGAPDNPTSSSDAEFTFSDSQRGVTFLCSLDGGAFATCPDGDHDSDADYGNLGPGNQTFQVEAVNSTGQAGAPATWTWTIAVSASFPISGNITGLFAPGVTQPLDLSFTNPYGFSLEVLSVSITVPHGTTKGGHPNPGCDGPTNMVVTQGFSGPVTVPAHATRSLQALGVPQAGWPQVEMPDLPINQDACEGTTFTLSYSGTATKG